MKIVTAGQRPSISLNKKLSDPAMAALVKKDDIYKLDATLRFKLDNSEFSFLNPINPPRNPEVMRLAVMGNNTLLQCLAAIVTNCDLVGGSLKYIGEEGSDKESPEAKTEFDRMNGFIVSPNGKTSLREVKECLRWDSEIYGYCFWEVGRDINGAISWYRHLPSCNTFLCGLDPDLVPTDRPVYRNGVLTNLSTREKFRRFVTINGRSKTYYKEFGDPRPVDPKTGQVNNALNLADSATEVIHTRNLPLTPYGATNWENNLPAVLGSKEAEIVNLQFFRDGGLPALVVCVSGGFLTDEAVELIENKFNGGKAADKIHKAIVLEARGDAALSPGVDGTIPAPKIDIKELGQQAKDGLFQEYDANCAKKIRSSVRLPAIFIGESDSYNYATARASLETTENQVFGPKRQVFDDILNNYILAKEGVPSTLWKYVSNSVKVSDPEGVTNALSALAAAGAIDSNSAKEIFNSIFNGELKPTEEEWGDLPIQLVVALLTAQNAEKLLGEKAAAAAEKLGTKFGGGTTSAPGLKGKTIPPNRLKVLPKPAPKPVKLAK